ncbi:putative electron carrier protein [Trypoxylus dichotomus]
MGDGDVQKGKKIFLRQCSRCHPIQKDPGHGMGPNLYGVVGRKVADAPGFTYSSAMMKRTFIWDQKHLCKFLKNPRKFIPGTNMLQCCLEEKEHRQNLIAYLRSASDSH